MKLNDTGFVGVMMILMFFLSFGVADWKGLDYQTAINMLVGTYALGVPMLLIVFKGLKE